MGHHKRKLKGSSNKTSLRTAMRQKTFVSPFGLGVDHIVGFGPQNVG